MPGRDGFDIIAYVRAESGRGWSRSLPALAVSANDSDADAARAVTQGFDAFQAKPIDPKAVVEIVRRLAVPRKPG